MFLSFKFVDKLCFCILGYEIYIKELEFVALPLPVRVLVTEYDDTSVS